MLYASDFRNKGKIALEGNWGKAIGTGLVASLLGAGTIMARVSGGGGNSTGVENISDLNGIIPVEFQVPYLALLSLLSFSAIVFMIIHLTIGGAVTLGYVKFNLNLVDKKEASFADLFSEFHRLGTGLIMQMLRLLFTALWSLFFVFPGIYASYGYAMAPYILHDNPELTANEAITKSKELMDGNRWRLFCLEMSFLGWSLLVVMCTCGLGYVVLHPYMEASFAAFYREIKAEKYGREEKKEEFYEGYYNGRIV